MREERPFGGLANDSLQFSGERWRQAFLHKLSTEPVAVLQYMILVSKAYTPPPIKQEDNNQFATTAHLARTYCTTEYLNGCRSCRDNAHSTTGGLRGSHSS